MNFIKTTIVGGILFLVPLIVLLAIVGKALEISHKFVAPLAARIPFESPLGLETLGRRTVAASKSCWTVSRGVGIWYAMG